MRKLILVITVVVALTVVGGAGAAEPVRSEAVFDFPEPDVYAECCGRPGSSASIQRVTRRAQRPSG